MKKLKLLILLIPLLALASCDFKKGKGDILNSIPVETDTPSTTTPAPEPQDKDYSDYEISGILNYSYKRFTEYDFKSSYELASNLTCNYKDATIVIDNVSYSNYSKNASIVGVYLIDVFIEIDNVLYKNYSSFITINVLYESQVDATISGTFNFRLGTGNTPYIYFYQLTSDLICSVPGYFIMYDEDAFLEYQTYHSIHYNYPLDQSVTFEIALTIGYYTSDGFVKVDTSNSYKVLITLVKGAVM